MDPTVWLQQGLPANSTIIGRFSVDQRTDCHIKKSMCSNPSPTGYSDNLLCPTNPESLTNLERAKRSRFNPEILALGRVCRTCMMFPTIALRDPIIGCSPHKFGFLEVDRGFIDDPRNIELETSPCGSHSQIRKLFF
jgi:hypothetical protein